MTDLSSAFVQPLLLGSKFAVGEISDFAGVPAFYDAGDSKWMQGNTWVSGSLLTQSVRDLLGTDPDRVTLSDYDQLITGANRAVSLWHELPKVGDTTCMPMNNGTVLTINADGPRVVSTGFGNVITDVVSDGTFFYAFSANSSFTSAASPIRKSADGLSWSLISGTSIPTGFFWTTYSYKICNEHDSVVGHTAGSLASSGKGGVFFLGSRFLWLGWDGSANARALSSTDCITWTDVTAAMFGNATSSGPYHIYRNGSAVAFVFSGSCKFSVDGGATWSNATGGPQSFSFSNCFLQKNAAAAAKLIISIAGSAFFVSTNTGQSWSDRYSGISALIQDCAKGIAYKGGTILAASTTSTVARSIDDGATWSAVVFPAGAGLVTAVMTDGVNFYAQTASQQLLVSADGITWTIRLLPAGFVEPISSIAAIDSQMLVACAGGKAVISLDGGVTWKAGTQRSSVSSPVGVVRKVSAGAKDYVVIGSPNVSFSSGAVISADALSAGGSFFRATSTALNPARTGATAMVRVA